MVGTCVLLICS